MSLPTSLSRIMMPLFVALLCMHNAAYAHSALIASLPGEGQTMASPPSLMLHFDGPVSLMKLSIVGKDGEVATGFTAVAEPAEEFSLALPALADGSYTVAWSILGADGHTVSKSINFTVDASAGMAGMSEAVSHGHNSGTE